MIPFTLMELTEEQQNVVSTKGHEYVFVQAFAGTGKTSTLLEYVKQNSEKKILYLTFNNSLAKAENIQNETGTSFDSNTIHGLAFNALNIDPEKVGKLSIKYLKKIYNVSSLFANLILRSFDYFLSSTSIKPKLKHVYNTDTDGVKDPQEIVAHMVDLWEGMESGRYDIVHDFYLKKYMISRPTLDYDIILIDECQDITPCFMKILFRQRGTKLFVGDIYQQIYSFRNVLNPFKLSLDNRKNLKLSNTFRFGDDVCHLTNDFLSTFRGIETKDEGLKTESGSDTQVYFKGSPPEQEGYTYIARTNKELLVYAYKLAKEKKHFQFIGKEYKYEKEIHIFDNVKDQTEHGLDMLVEKFGHTTLKDAKNASRDLHKYNWVNRLEMIEKFNDNPWKLIQEYNSPEANIKLITAHQSKGLEFDNVVLANDFKKLVHPKLKNYNDYYQDDDYNILYVSMTRCKKKLYINTHIAEFLRLKYDFDISVSEMKTHNACHSCGSLSKQVVTHSMYHLPEYIRPNHKVATCYCSNCIDSYLDSVRVIDGYFNRK